MCGEFQNQEIGGVAQKEVTNAARSGANVGLKAARAGAPFLTGTYEKALAIKGEKVKKSNVGKKGYQITFSPKYTQELNEAAKPIKRPGIYGGDPEGSFYYPNSVEYGRLDKYGKSNGLHYLRKVADQNSESIKQKMLQTLDKAIQKRVR